MIRFLFRVLATLALAVAVVMAVLDATRSILASMLVLTPLGDSWQAASGETFGAVRGFVLANAPAFVWDPVMTTILSAPGFVVFACLALLFYAIGHRRERRVGRAPGVWPAH